MAHKIRMFPLLKTLDLLNFKKVSVREELFAVIYIAVFLKCHRYMLDIVTDNTIAKYGNLTSFSNNINVFKLKLKSHLKKSLNATLLMNNG